MDRKGRASAPPQPTRRNVYCGRVASFALDPSAVEGDRAERKGKRWTLRLPKSRALRGLFFGLRDLQNPWDLARVALPGTRPIDLRPVDSSAVDAYRIDPDERRVFLRALARTVLGKDTNSLLVGSDGSANPGNRGDGEARAPPPWMPLLDSFMAGQYGWEDCPAPIRLRVGTLVDELTGRLGANLVGLYVCGSLAFGSFNPRWSDIDIVGVTRQPLDPDSRRSVAEAFLRHSQPPRGVESMFIAEQVLRTWVFPTPYDFYFSEKRRRAYEADLRSGAWRTWYETPGMSNFLAAHIPQIQKRGVRLWGAPIEQTFPPIPDKDYVASILLDFESKKARLPATTISGVLNACRCYAYLGGGGLLSKEEAALWALRVLPRADRAIVQRALEVYRGHRSLSDRFNAEEVARFFDDMGRRLDALQAHREPRVAGGRQAPVGSSIPEAARPLAEGPPRFSDGPLGPDRRS